MANPHWRERLQQELRRQRLPSEYISRLVEELSDHAADLLTENASMDAIDCAESRLGTPEQLASLAGSEFRRRTFAGRHPLVTFVAGPIVAMVTTLVVVCLVAFGLAWLVDTAMGGELSANDELCLPPSSLEMGIMRCFNAAVRFMPFVVPAWLFMRLGRRTGLRAWSAGACCILALVAVFFTSVLTPATAQSRAIMMIGVGLKFGLDQVLQAALPLGFAAWLIWRHYPFRASEIAA